MSVNLQIAVVGAMGQMGAAVLEQLAERLPPNVKVFAVDQDECDGEVVDYGHHELQVHPVSEFAFDAVHAALFVESGAEFAEARSRARGAGATVVEFAGADEATRLQGAAAARGGAAQPNGIVMPGTGVLPLAMALKALSPLPLAGVTVAAYLSASHLGQAGLEELANQTTALFSQRDAEVEAFPKRIAFNVLPAVGVVDAAGVAAEEQRLAEQLPRLLEQPGLKVYPACAYVPAFFGAAWAVTVELAGEAELEKARAAFVKADIVCNGGEDAEMATQMDVVGSDRLVVERLRLQHGRLSFWLVADALRISAAAWADLLRKMVESGYFA